VRIYRSELDSEPPAERLSGAGTSRSLGLTGVRRVRTLEVRSFCLYRHRTEPQCQQLALLSRRDQVQISERLFFSSVNENVWPAGDQESGMCVAERGGDAVVGDGGGRSHRIEYGNRITSARSWGTWRRVSKPLHMAGFQPAAHGGSNPLQVSTLPPGSLLLSGNGFELPDWKVPAAPGGYT